MEYIGIKLACPKLLVSSDRMLNLVRKPTEDPAGLGDPKLDRTLRRVSKILRNIRMDIRLTKNEFYEKAEALAAHIDRWDREARVLIIGHRDGDGMAAASTAWHGLRHLGFKLLSVEILLSPDEEVVQGFLDKHDPRYVLTCDICANFDEFFQSRVADYIITDHHPQKEGHYGNRQLNAIEFGFDDERDASGSTTVFCLFYPLHDREFWTTQPGKVMICHAVAGASSDFQFQDNNISGINREVVRLGVATKAVTVKKGIKLFGRGIYPVHVTLSRQVMFTKEECLELVQPIIDLKDGSGNWRRIVDLSKEEKVKIMDKLLSHLRSIIEDPLDFLKRYVIGNVIEVPGLAHLPCTELLDGRRTLDPREIYHAINYACRQGKAMLAFEVLNFEIVPDEYIKELKGLHQRGDREIANAIKAAETGSIPMERDCDGRFMWVDLTGVIYYDQVGPAAGVLMNIHKELELVVSICQVENDTYKVSVRAAKPVWNSIDQGGEAGDVNKVFARAKQVLGIEFQSGGHRFACSSYMPRSAVSTFNALLKEYYEGLAFTRG